MSGSDIFAAAWRAFRFAWPQLVGTDLAYKAAAFALLFPLSSLALRGFLALGGNQVVADLDILVFALSPLGVVTLVAMGAILLTVVALQVACLMTIGLAAEQRTRIGVLQTLEFVAGRAVPVVRLSAAVVGRTILISLPFLAAGGAVFLWLLTDYDINYYLSEKPPVSWLAAALIGSTLVALLAVLLPRLIGWTFAMPLVVFEGMPPAQALRQSTERMAGHRTRVALVIAVWAGVSLAAGAVVFGAVRLLAVNTVELVIGRPAAVVFVVGVIVVVWGAANLLVSVGGMVAFALLAVRLYQAWAPSTESRRSWAPKAPESAQLIRFGWSPRTLAAVFIGVCLVAAALGAVLIAGVPTDADVEIIAHRGAAGAAPENTLAAFERAIGDGADWVELDVQETADGRVVVLHDADLMKIAGVDLAIWDATYDELQDIDIGSWFAPAFADQRVPLLSEVLELCKGRVGVFIELKYYGHDQQLEERVVDIVEAAGMASDIVVMSLKYGGIQKVQAFRPGWRVGLLTATAVGDLTRLDADFLAVNAGLATGTFVRATHRRGKDAYVWTINDRMEMVRFIGRGIDGIITDEPGALREVRAAVAGLSPLQRLLLEVALRLGIVPQAEDEEGDDLEGETEIGPAAAEAGQAAAFPW